MRCALLILFVVGCDAGEPPKPAPDPAKPATKSVPDGPYVIHYNCFHSNEPWSRGGNVHNQAFDLAAGTHTLLAYDYDGIPKPVEPPKPEPKVSPLTQPKIAKLDALAVKVLTSGPFKAEIPVPEGISCELVIASKATELFKITKSYTKQNDAVTELVLALRP